MSAAVETKRRRTQLREWLLLSCVHRDNGNTCEDFTEACGYCNAADAIREAEEIITYLRAELETALQVRDFQQRRADERMSAYERQGAMHADALDALAEARRALDAAKGK